MGLFFFKKTAILVKMTNISKITPKYLAKIKIIAILGTYVIINRNSRSA